VCKLLWLIIGMLFIMAVSMVIVAFQQHTLFMKSYSFAEATKIWWGHLLKYFSLAALYILFAVMLIIYIKKFNSGDFLPEMQGIINKMWIDSEKKRQAEIKRLEEKLEKLKGESETLKQADKNEERPKT